MNTIANDFAVDMTLRLQGAGIVQDPDSVRRDRRRSMPLEDAPAIHVIDGDDELMSENSGCQFRRKRITLAIFVRDDSSYDAADPLIVATLRAIAPLNSAASPAYRREGRISFGNMHFESEIADGDALRVDIEATVDYTCASWKLDTQ